MKRKFVTILIALALCFNLAGGLGFVSVLAGGGDTQAATEEAAYAAAVEKFAQSDRNMEVGYLLRENFSPYASAGSGWRKVNMPNGTGVATIKSLNPDIETYIEKDFVAQSGEITVEFKAILVSDVENGEMVVLGKKNGTTVRALQIRIENNALKYVKPDGEKVTLGSLNQADWTGIKIVASATDGKATVFINGVSAAAAANLDFTASCDTLGGLRFGIAATSRGTFTLGTISVYKGYDVHETWGVAGVKVEPDPNYDYNQMAIPEVTVNDGTIGNDNTDLAYLAFDGDPDTYWYHNPEYPINKNVYFKTTYGNRIVPIDYIEITFASDFNSFFGITTRDSADNWGEWTPQQAGKVGATIDIKAGETLQIERPNGPKYLVEFALGFGATGIENTGIKIAEFKAFCKNSDAPAVPSFTSDWEKSDTENTEASTESYYGASSQAEFNILTLKDDNATESLTVSKSFNRTGDVTAEFATFFTDKADGNRVGLENANGDFIGVETANGKLSACVVTSGDKKLTALDGFRTNLWYRPTIRYDAKANAFELDVNGWAATAPVKLADSFKTAAWTKFKAVTAAGETELKLDNVKVYRTPAESNVPEVQACDTGDTILTMQACSLWREGTHVGWHTLDKEDMYYRQPILGWYDEGTAEVADWEIKMAAEHGINNFMYCWYRYGSTNGPVLGSNYADEIWDGLFKSKFRDDIKFTIMFENSGGHVYGYEDLMNNLMPYWIETFFKNPNYLKTADNKPILYIYDFNSLLAGVGDCNNDGDADRGDLRYVLDAMREACVEAGFGGLYISAENRQNGAVWSQAIVESGFDSMFAYTFSTGTYNDSNDKQLVHAQSVLNNQRTVASEHLASLDADNMQGSVNADFKVLPNISKSWDTRGWTDSGFSTMSAAYMYDLEHYREYALWVKNVYGGAVIDSQGTKMIMLDNWNEYSEGHWLMPTYGTPSYKEGRYAYGYLDVLREVFGTGEYAHEDYLPLEDGFGPYDAWYPLGWDDPVGIYTEIFGEAEDNSVSDTQIVDWQIGYNTLGGTTVHVKSVEGGVINASEAVRVTVSAEAVASLKSANSALTIKMKYGEVKLTAAQIAALDANKNFEVIFNCELDLTDVAIAVRRSANGEYRIADGEVYTVALKQAGYALGDFEAEVKLVSVNAKATGYVLFEDGEIVKPAGEWNKSTVTVENNVEIVVVK